jgi:hypothetical protein
LPGGAIHFATYGAENSSLGSKTDPIGSKTGWQRDGKIMSTPGQRNLPYKETKKNSPLFALVAAAIMARLPRLARQEIERAMRILD